MYTKLSPHVQDIMDPTYWRRGSSYANQEHIKEIQIYERETSISIEAIVKWTSYYRTGIDLSVQWLRFSCLCQAFDNDNGCKHVSGLARRFDQEYLLTLSPLSICHNKTSQSYTVGIKIHPSLIATPPIQIQQDPVYQKIMDQLSLLQTHTDSSPMLEAVESTEPIVKQSRSVRLISTLGESLSLQKDPECHYRIKIDLVKWKKEFPGIYDIEIHTYKAKRLKNGNLSFGQEVYQESIRTTGLQDWRHFVWQKYESYYTHSVSTRLTFASAPEMIIRLLSHTQFPISTLDNEPIAIIPWLQVFRLAVEKTTSSKPYSITPVFYHETSNGRIRVTDSLPNTVKILHAPGTPYYGIMSAHHSLSFFRSELPVQLISGIISKPITLSRSEWAEFRVSPGFDALLTHIDAFDWLEDEIRDINPMIRLTIEISSDYTIVQLDYDYIYGTLRVHPMSEKQIYSDENGVIRRDREKEKNEYNRIIPLLDLCEMHDLPLSRGIQAIDADSDIFFDQVEVLIADGILVEYRQSTHRVSQAPLSAQLRVSSGEDWFDVSVDLILGEQVLQNAAEILMAIRKWGKYITLDNGTIIQLKQDISRTLADWDELGITEKNIDSGVQVAKYNIGLLKAKTGNLSTFELPAEVEKLQMALTDFQWIPEKKLPTTATVTLREYQKQGYEWLHFLHTYHFSGILADDMGLGKTIQTLVFLESLYSQARHGKKKLPPSLIIVPTSLVLNWMDEAAKFVPELSIDYIRDGKTGLAGITDGTEIIIVSYGILANLVEQSDIKEKKWYYIILDEAQNIKNSKSERAKAILSLSSSYRLALSGTPIENNLLELLSIFQFLMPGFLGYEARFRDRYMKWDTANLETLSRKVKPFILRRTKENVLKDLPAKQEEIIHLEMGSEQKEFYNSLKTTYQAQITEQLETVGLAKSQFIVLDALLKLRQASLMPQLVKMDGNTVRESAKLEYLRENIEEMITRWHSLLIFSQFTGFLAYIREILDEKKIDYNYLDGQTSREDRKKLVDSYNAGVVKVFLISLKAGGVGLNLTGADYVIHMDPWWNPAVENQATDRAHRMWQTKTVFVQKLIVRDTVEEKILKLQEKKKKLIDDLFSWNFHGSLSEVDIRYIFE